MTVLCHLNPLLCFVGICSPKSVRVKKQPKWHVYYYSKYIWRIWHECISVNSCLWHIYTTSKFPCHIKTPIFRSDQALKFGRRWVGRWARNCSFLWTHAFRSRKLTACRCCNQRRSTCHHVQHMCAHSSRCHRSCSVRRHTNWCTSSSCP